MFNVHGLKELILLKLSLISVSQFSHSVVSTLRYPMECSTPGLPVHHQLPEFTQTMSIELVMHRFRDVIDLEIDKKCIDMAHHL